MPERQAALLALLATRNGRTLSGEIREACGAWIDAAARTLNDESPSAGGRPGSVTSSVPTLREAGHGP